MDLRPTFSKDIEGIAWPHGDEKFLLECWKMFQEWALWTSEIFFNTEREILYFQAAMWRSIHYINTNEMANHLTFAAKGVIYHVTIVTMIFSRVKVAYDFHMWRYHVSMQKITWYFIGVYIIIFFLRGSGFYMYGKWATIITQYFN